MNAVELAAAVRNVEARFLAGMAQFPVEGIDAAARSDLTDESFAFPEHRWLFKAIGIAFEEFKRILFGKDLLYLNELADSPFPNYGWPHPLLALLSMAPARQALPIFAEQVAAESTRRARIAELRKELGELQR